MQTAEDIRLLNSKIQNNLCILQKYNIILFQNFHLFMSHPESQTEQKKNDPSPKKRAWWAIGRALLIIFGSLAVLGVFAFAVLAAWISHDLPDPNTLTTRDIPQSKRIVAAPR